MQAWPHAELHGGPCPPPSSQGKGGQSGAKPTLGTTLPTVSLTPPKLRSAREAAAASAGKADKPQQQQDKEGPGRTPASARSNTGNAAAAPAAARRSEGAAPASAAPNGVSSSEEEERRKSKGLIPLLGSFLNKVFGGEESPPRERPPQQQAGVGGAEASAGAQGEQRRPLRPTEEATPPPPAAADGDSGRLIPKSPEVARRMQASVEASPSSRTVNYRKQFFADLEDGTSVDASSPARARRAEYKSSAVQLLVSPRAGPVGSAEGGTGGGAPGGKQSRAAIHRQLFRTDGGKRDLPAEVAALQDALTDVYEMVGQVHERDREIAALREELGDLRGSRLLDEFLDRTVEDSIQVFKDQLEMQLRKVVERGSESLRESYEQATARALELQDLRIAKFKDLVFDNYIQRIKEIHKAEVSTLAERFQKEADIRTQQSLKKIVDSLMTLRRKYGPYDANLKDIEQLKASMASLEAVLTPLRNLQSEVQQVLREAKSLQADMELLQKEVAVQGDRLVLSEASVRGGTQALMTAAIQTLHKLVELRDSLNRHLSTHEQELSALTSITGQVALRVRENRESLDGLCTYVPTMTKSLHEDIEKMRTGELTVIGPKVCV